MKYHYTYKITNLNPKTIEKFYIGVHSSSSLENDYMSSSIYIKQSIKELCVDNFSKEILSIWISRELAEAHEEWLHGYIDVANNPEYYNKRNALAEFTTSKSSTLKSIKTKQSKEWQETKGRKWLADIIQTRNDPQWKATIGVERKRKEKITRNDPIWKQTKGVERKRKERLTKSDPDWIAEHTVTCYVCNKSMLNSGAFKRWHNENCQSK